MIQDVIKIGNSKGIRLSKPLLKELQIGKQVDLEVIETVDHQKIIQIRPIVSGRHTWLEAFNSEDAATLIPDTIVNSWDSVEWTW